MVFDGIRGINLLFKMSVWSYQMVILVPCNVQALLIMHSYDTKPALAFKL